MKKTFIALALILQASFSHAIIIDGKEWRHLMPDPTFTIPGAYGFTWNDYDESFSSVTGHCEANDCIVRGIDYTGWIWASIAEVDAFITTFYPEGGYFSDTVSYVNAPDASFHALQAEDVVGNTFESTYAGDGLPDKGLFISSGLTRDTSPTDSNVGGRVQVSAYFHPLDGTAHSQKQYGYVPKDMPVDSIGAWFYKPVDVPEPGMVSLFLLGLLATRSIRKRMV